MNFDINPLRGELANHLLAININLCGSIEYFRSIYSFENPIALH